MRCAPLRRFRLRLSVRSKALQEPLHLARHLSRVVAAGDRLQNVPSNAACSGTMMHHDANAV